MSTHKSEHTAYEDEDKYLPPGGPNSTRSRTLVLCFDGTGNKIDSNPTNVSRIFSMLRKDDCNQQMVYYQTGIGTYTNHRFGPIASVVAKTLDSMFGGGIDRHIQDGYEFLMQNYRARDRICIFGFSRGAYTARALAAMIHKVGLLPPSNIRHIKYAYKTFLTTGQEGRDMARVFKKSFSIKVDIDFVGIWDSVGSIGVGLPPIPFGSQNTTIRCFRHALSLDERRCRFKANVWTAYETEEEGRLKGEGGLKGGGRLKPNSSKIRNELKWSSEERCESGERATDIEEVWFSGCHSDVGGGAVPPNTRHSLANISLRWMIRQCFSANTGIMFTVESISELGMDPISLHPRVFERPAALPAGNLKIKRPIRSKVLPSAKPEPGPRTSEEEEDLHDAMAPSYDQLELKPLWWLLEIIPTIRRDVKNDKQAVRVFRANLGGPRIIAAQKDYGVKVHRSVKTRREAQYEPKRPSGTRAQEERYVPKPTFEVDLTWVV